MDSFNKVVSLLPEAKEFVRSSQARRPGQTADLSEWRARLRRKALAFQARIVELYLEMTTAPVANGDEARSTHTPRRKSRNYRSSQAEGREMTGSITGAITVMRQIEKWQIRRNLD